MKRKIFIAACTVAASSMLLSSCIGSFSLSNKVLAWNQTIDNKFVNEVVFVALWIVPVYEISLIADVLVINSIEFWSGENPVTEAGVVKTVQGKDGVYTVETLENGYKIENEEGQQMSLVYDKESNTWSRVANGETDKLIKIVDNNNAIVYLPNGQERKVELSENGVLAFRQSIENSSFFAAK